MTIRAIELIALITLSTWVGLYLLIRQYGGSAEKHAGTIYLCYGAYLLLRAVAKTSPMPAYGLLLARFAYIPGIIALVSLCHLACVFNPLKKRTIKRIVMGIIVFVSLVMGTLAVSTPLILQRIVYFADDAWPHTENGPAFWIWLIYISVLIGVTLYCFGRIWVSGGMKRIIKSEPGTQNPLRKFAGASFVVTSSGFLNHIGKAYEDSFSIVPSIIFILSTIYLAYLLVTTFDRAFRDPVSGKGMSLTILISTLSIIALVHLSIGAARVIGRETFSQSTLFIMHFLAAGLAAGLAGTQHRLYAAFRHEVRRISRQGRQTNINNVVELALPQSIAPSPSIPLSTQPDPPPDQSSLDAPDGDVDSQPSPNQEVTNPAPTDNAQPDEGNSATDQLYRELRLALRSLHDPARLGAIHSLASDLPGETVWQRGEALQQQLIQAIQRLEPHGDECYANQWQHYQILWRLYYEGQSRQDIMQALSLSERHYQRHLHDALVVFVAQWQNSGKNRIDANPLVE